ncbi:MAG: polyprenyl synthetase family protein [Ginsengibacter sp.]
MLEEYTNQPLIHEDHQVQVFLSGDKGLASFKELAQLFESKMDLRHFPQQPEKLYNAAQYLLDFGGKRIRPVICLMGNQLFDEIKDAAFDVAIAVELFHNFTLVHDDIMDRAPLRRGQPTVHIKFGESTALLAGDVMLVKAYSYLNKISNEYLHKILELFNDTAQKVCEGQQLDMDFESKETVDFDEYVEMISLKTSVLLAASIQMGAILGGAGVGNQQHLYEFGKNLGIAFQIQDDYLDAFGDPEKFGKKHGGDIMANKKTFLLLQAMKVATPAQKEELKRLLETDNDQKISSVIEIYKACKVDEWANELKTKYLNIAMKHLEDTAVISVRKKPLEELAHLLMDREV